jgi:hypothetical protein
LLWSEYILQIAWAGNLTPSSNVNGIWKGDLGKNLGLEEVTRVGPHGGSSGRESRAGMLAVYHMKSPHGGWAAQRPPHQMPPLNKPPFFINFPDRGMLLQEENTDQHSLQCVVHFWVITSLPTSTSEDVSLSGPRLSSQLVYFQLL